MVVTPIIPSAPAVSEQLEILAPAVRRTLRLHVSVTTYNRPQQLRELLFDVARESRGYKASVDIYDDASNSVPSLPEELTEELSIALHRRERNGGIEGFWHLIGTAFERIRQVDADYYFFLQDDVRLAPQALSEAVRQWNLIDDPARVCLNLLCDSSREGQACWTRFSPVLRCFGNVSVWHSQWTDMLFLADRAFFEALSFRVDPIHPHRWRHDPFRSSGVGEQFSVRLHQQGRHVYQVSKSLVEHGQHPSQMHPVLRTHQPLVSKSRLQPLVGGMATIPERSEQLALSVASILPQLDQLHVYLNGFMDIPDCLRDPRITPWLSSEQAGDLGDRGKFFRCAGTEGYFFGLDDDIVYPPDYVSRLVESLQAAGNLDCVGVHGVVLPRTIRSYARDRWVVHGGSELSRDQPVHILGTGLIAFHTSALKLNLTDFPEPNIADLYVAVAAQKQQCGLLAIARSRNWIRFQRVKDTIFSMRDRFDKLYTEIINSVPEWTLWAERERHDVA